MLRNTFSVVKNWYDTIKDNLQEDFKKRSREKKCIYIIKEIYKIEKTWKQIIENLFLIPGWWGIIC